MSMLTFRAAARRQGRAVELIGSLRLETCSVLEPVAGASGLLHPAAAGLMP